MENISARDWWHYNFCCRIMLRLQEVLAKKGLPVSCLWSIWLVSGTFSKAATENSSASVTIFGSRKSRSKRRNMTSNFWLQAVLCKCIWWANLNFTHNPRWEWGRKYSLWKILITNKWLKHKCTHGLMNCYKLWFNYHPQTKSFVKYENILIFSHVKRNRNYDYNAMASLHIRLAKKMWCLWHSIIDKNMDIWLLN